MSRADYAHWNEEQDRVWWEEEGKHAESDAENARFERDEEHWRGEGPDDRCIECDGKGKDVDDVVCEHCGGDGIEP